MTLRPVARFGAKMMGQMGWEAGKGLVRPKLTTG
jgi:hypothetical protein